MAEESIEERTARVVAQVAKDTAHAVAEAAIAAALVVAKEHVRDETTMALLQEDVKNIETQQACFEEATNKKWDSLSLTFDKVFSKLEEITLGRPTWTVSLIMGGLFSLCVGLIVFVVTRRQGGV